MRRFSSPALVLAFLAISAGACRRATPRLLFLREDGEIGHLYLVDVRGDAPPTLALDAQGWNVHTAMVVDDGRAALVVLRTPGTRTPGEVWRVRVVGDRLVPDARLAMGLGGSIIAASRDGSVLLVSQSAGGRDAVFAVSAGGALVRPVVTYRYHAGGDVTPDGTRAVLSGIPPECTATALHACPMQLHSVDLTTTVPTVRLLSPGPRGAYQPRFVPDTHGAEIAYQTTEFDDNPACNGNLNRCRHDIVVRDWSFSRPPVVLRRNALGANYSPTGQRVAFAAIEAASGCTQLPCPRLSLFVGPTSGTAFRRIVEARVSVFGRSFWSYDDEWMAYVAWSETPGVRRSVQLSRRDGAPGRRIDNAYVSGFIRAR